MSRPLRISYPGACYHVMNRGLARNAIFFNNSHREIFLELLFEIYNRYQVEIHAYCLMGNHYHLLIRTPHGNISRAMRHLDGVYTQKINRLIGRDGPLFRGRYKAILVQADAYLLSLSRYIHLNPVRARLVKKAEKFYWSSYRFYISGKELCWLYTKEVLSYFDDEWRRAKYKAFVEDKINNEFDDFYKNNINTPILGSAEFSRNITEKHLEERHKIADIPEHKLLINSQYISIDAIMNRVAEFYGVNNQYLKLPRRKNGNLPRAIGMYVSYMVGHYSFPIIAKAFANISASGVSRTCHRVQAMLCDNEKIKHDLEKLQAM